MVKKGVTVRETEPTEWVSQMVATRKKNGDVRICLDPRDLNKALKRPHHPMRTADDVASRLGNANAGCKDWILADQARKTILSTDNVQYTIIMGGTGFSACLLASTQHQKCSRKPWKDFLKDIHAQSLWTTSSSRVLLKKNMMPPSGKSWRELDRLA